MPLTKMQHMIDPAQLIRDAVGDISKFSVMFNDVLIGMYMRPEKTSSGLYLADTTRKEDEYQGKAGLVLAKGPMAFKDDDNFKFLGQNLEVGDWVAIWISDGRKIQINKQLCRMVEDRHIRLKIPAPDLVY